MAISDLMITKPGGVTTSEALAMGLPLLIYHPLPGQEEDNAEFLWKSGLAFLAKTENDLILKIESILNDSRDLKSMQQLTALSNTLMRGRQCPRIPVAALSTGSHLASFIKSSLASWSSSQFPTFDVAQTTGWTGGEQNKQVEQTAILLRL